MEMNNYDFITCASYYGTGSSAITDFFSEFDDIFSLGEYEYRFVQDPNGIADLEYNIIENNHRHNTSNAIKNFKKYILECKKMGYGGYDIFGKQLDLLVDEYLEKIVQLKTHTWWNKDRIDKGSLFCFIDRIYSLFMRLIHGEIKSEARYSLLKNKEIGYYTIISEKEFLDATKQFINDLFGYVNKEKKKYIMVDQIVPPTNARRYIRYFNNIKIIVVDRDPRDIFLLEKYVWKWGVIPVDNVEEFVKWFKITRNASFDDDQEHVLKINFEDLIYKYDITKKILTDFVGIDLNKHTAPFEKFDPKISINNTNLKGKFEDSKKEIEYIEKNLKEYLYHF